MTFRELVIDNPLQIEFKRAFRRFFGVSRTGALNTAVLIICVVLYALLMTIVITYREYMSPIAILYIQLLLLTFIVPSNLHGAIAAEKEKRTWDMLLVAPITNAQIVIGKLIGGVLLLLFISALLLPATLISFTGDHQATFSMVFAGEVLILGFALFLATLSIFVSSHAKRAFAAQLTIYAILILGLLIWPMFASVLAPGRDGIQLMLLHPFVALGMLWDPGYDRPESGLFNGYLQFGVYLLFAAFLVFVTIKDLSNSEDAGSRRR